MLGALPAKPGTLPPSRAKERSMKRHLSIAVFAAFGLSLAPAAPAAAQDESGEWRFRIAPYVLAPVMNGDAAVRGAEAEVDLGPEDVFSNLNIGFQGYFEARADKWGIGLDAIYMDLDATDDDRIAELDVSQSAYTATAFFRATPNLDVYVGGRFNDLGADLDFQGPLDLPTLEQDKSWVDPLIGVRYSAPIGDKWNLQISGDVGGFGIGSDIAVNVWPMIGYELSNSAQLAFGYRVLYMDYESGSGTDYFKYDVVTHGPVIGAAFDF
jgi:hypothetical protein